MNEIYTSFISASIVAYKTDVEELKKAALCMASSIVETIYIVDNSPTDALKAISDCSDKIVYIFNNANLGYGRAHNMAIRKSIEKRTKYHIVMNPDIEVQPRAIEKLVEFMDSNATVGLTMPKILYPHGGIQYLCKLLPTPVDLIFRRFFAFTSWAKRREEKYELRAINYEQAHFDIPFLSGCFIFLRTDILEKIGMFDEKFFLYMEDVDLCRRVHQVSQTAFYPAVSVVHSYAKGSYKNYTLLRHHIHSAIKYFNKWGWVFDQGRKKANRKILQELHCKENG
ncbi:MAG: glycosyltransferase family 2 protein [Prevotellaceae bacterium]|jgi:GT2 family glycosyltransferase|nr:glycosyltransferase family 2 protein [Prevotellaceae bacterium]